MRLNVGCGENKISGYINIDIDGSLKPDYVMPLWDLDFEDESVNEVLSRQSIEHLGFFKTRYFLSEALRVLKYEKPLIIETVDIEESFKFFLNAKNQDERERVLNWIFGSETRYMNHLYCFPYELLEKMLGETGFEICKVERFLYEPLRPAIKVVAIKKKKDLNEAKLRKILVKNGFIEVYDEIVYSEIERVIRSIRWDGIDRRYLLELSFISPLLSYALSTITQTDEPDFFKKLWERNISGYLYERFLRYLDIHRSFEAAYKRLKDEFFDNPERFMYNFIGSGVKPSKVIFAITETIFRYKVKKEGL